jgi:hypothetical protein
LTFGGYGLKALEPERVTARQIEAARRAITRAMKRGPGVDPHLPDVPVSTKPAEVRMGSGKGSPEYWVARIKPGRIMFEIDGVPDGHGPRGPDARRGEAADPHQDRRAPGRRGGCVMAFGTKIADVRAKSTTSSRRWSSTSARSSSTCASSAQRAVGGDGRIKAVPARHRPRQDRSWASGSAPPPPRNPRLEETSGHAEARPHGAGRQRQDGQDRHGLDRTSRDAPPLQEVHPPLEEVRGA